jgi:hypothetical protein
MVRRAIDTIGPLPMDEDGKVGIISITDTFSRFNLLYPVSDMTAETAVLQALIPHIGIFGVPEQLVSDNGSNFANRVVTEIAKVAGFEQILITPESHQENSLEERNHKESARHLRALIFECEGMMRWSVLAPLAQRIVNAQFRPAIGCSPTTMLFGAAVDTEEGIFLEFSKREQKELDLSEKTEQMLAVQSRLVKKAQELLAAHDAKHTEKQTTEETEFANGSYVLMTYPPGPSRQSQPPSKLHTNWKGPLQVVSHQGSDYMLRDIVTHKLRKNPINVSRLKQYVHDSDQLTPAQAARRDLQEFAIQEVQEHRFVKGRKTGGKNDMQFRTRWLGYGPSEDTWQSWRSLVDTKALHKYLHNQKMDDLIPSKYRRDSYEDSDDECG